MKSDECYSSANPTVERRLPRSLLKILKLTIYFMVVEFFGKNVKNGVYSTGKKKKKGDQKGMSIKTNKKVLTI